MPCLHFAPSQGLMVSNSTVNSVVYNPISCCISPLCIFINVLAVGSHLAWLILSWAMPGCFVIVFVDRLPTYLLSIYPLWTSFVPNIALNYPEKECTCDRSLDLSKLWWLTICEWRIELWLLSCRKGLKFVNDMCLCMSDCSVKHSLCEMRR